MTEADRPQLDHDDNDPTKYLGYSCASCNASAGASKGNRMRAAAYRREKGLPDPPALEALKAQRRSGEPQTYRSPYLDDADPAPAPARGGTSLEKPATATVTLEKAEPKRIMPGDVVPTAAVH